jgi:cytochrome c5
MMRTAVFFVSLGLGAIALAGAGFAQDVQLPDGPAKEKIEAACTVCHGISEVTSNPRSKKEWAETVDTMIARGAAVSDEDYPAVVDYLASHFAPAGAASGGGAPASHP